MGYPRFVILGVIIALAARCVNAGGGAQSFPLGMVIQKYGAKSAVNRARNIVEEGYSWDRAARSNTFSAEILSSAWMMAVTRSVPEASPMG